jgi:hypothetical protein
VQNVDDDSRQENWQLKNGCTNDQRVATMARERLQRWLEEYQQKDDVLVKQVSELLDFTYIKPKKNERCTN